MPEGRRPWRSQLKQSANLPFLHLFVLFRISRYWMMPVYQGGYSLLSLLIQMLMLIFSRNVFTDTFRNNVSPTLWAVPRPVKLTDKKMIASHERRLSCVSWGCVKVLLPGGVRGGLLWFTSLMEDEPWRRVIRVGTVASQCSQGELS